MSISTEIFPEIEESITRGLAVLLISFAILFFSLYALLTLVLNKNEEKGLITLSNKTSVEAMQNDPVRDQGLVESVKPVKKEAETNVLPIPDRIVAPSIELDRRIVNPGSRDSAVLDSALLKGVVYYPGSGYLNENANMLFFGHSSFLPVVKNENFRAFNRIKELKVGDLIEVYSGDEKYTYRVTSNKMAKDSEVRVNFGSSTPKLTLTTCNSFGEKEDRYVVEAELTF